MIAETQELVATTVPAQPAPVEPPPSVTIDHVRAHEVTCWWDFAECRWVCGG